MYRPWGRRGLSTKVESLAVCGGRRGRTTCDAESCSGLGSNGVVCKVVACSSFLMAHGASSVVIAGSAEGLSLRLICFVQ